MIDAKRKWSRPTATGWDMVCVRFFGLDAKWICHFLHSSTDGIQLIFSASASAFNRRLRRLRRRRRWRQRRRRQRPMNFRVANCVFLLHVALRNTNYAAWQMWRASFACQFVFDALSLLLLDVPKCYRRRASCFCAALRTNVKRDMYRSPFVSLPHTASPSSMILARWRASHRARCWLLWILI